MSIRNIISHPHKILRKISESVPLEKITDKEIQRLITDMKDTLRATEDGVGLAAPQIGKNLRIFIVSQEAKEVDRYEKELRKNPNLEPYEKREWEYYVFINPVVKKKSRKKVAGTEGCLSVRGKFGTVNRCEKITIEAYNEKGEKITFGAAGFFARVIQHELDHLEGVLFVDKS